MALALEEAGKGPRRRQGPHQRAGLQPVGPARGQEGPDVAGRDGSDVVQPRRLAEMAGQEAQEGGDVAVIGLHRLGAHAPLDGKIGQPLHLGGGKVGGSNEDGRRSVHAASVA